MSIYIFQHTQRKYRFVHPYNKYESERIRRKWIKNPDPGRRNNVHTLKFIFTLLLVMISLEARYRNLMDTPNTWEIEKKPSKLQQKYDMLSGPSNKRC